MLIGIQKEISSIELDNEIEKIADAYIGSILVEKELFNEQERDLVSERVINALPLNLDRFNDIWKSILKQLTDEMKTTFSTYQEQKTQGLKRQKKHTQESLSSILHKFNV